MLGVGLLSSLNTIPPLRLGVLLALSTPRVASAPASIISEIPDVEDEDEDEADDGAAPHNVEYAESFAYGDGDEVFFDDFYNGVEMFGGGEMFDGGDEYTTDPEEQSKLASVLFSKFDRDADGKLSEAELRQALSEQANHYAVWGQQSAEDETLRLVSEVDDDGDGKISRAEFQAADEALYVPHEVYLPRMQAFGFADADGDELLDVRELALLLFPDNSPRFEEFRSFLASNVLKAHGVPADGAITPRQLAASNQPTEQGRSGMSGASGTTGWGRRGGGGLWADDLPASEVGEREEGDAVGEEGGEGERMDLSYLASHDRDGDGKLNAKEVADFLAPLRAQLHAGYVEDELTHVLQLLRSPAQGSQGSADGEGAGGAASVDFDLGTVQAVASRFISTFHILLGAIMADGAGAEQEDPREL